MSKSREQGFTITELSLAMSFLAFIMVFVVIVLLQLMNIYNKGIAMSQINQTGRQIADDIGNYTKFAKSDSIIYQSSNRRLCTGQVSYIWNTDGSTTNKFDDGSAFSMIRITDASSVYCSESSKMPSASDPNVNILAGTGVNILKFDVVTQGGIVQVQSVLSTSGDNKPRQKDDGKWTCVDSGNSGRNNPYCYYASFDNTVYTRGE